ncbi:MAG: ketopantoate reductase C-terminal domain-containing protein [Candidatus Rokubacteria bacterium]|nr:ketopantoate reductase C-terminal domain-containing protein [Candidatus Rokubacteria bacterium]
MPPPSSSGFSPTSGSRVRGPARRPRPPVLRREPSGRPSMLQDVMKGRRTEINYLNGYVSEQGRQVGVKTPINDKIVELVNAPGVGLLKPDPKNLDPLWALVPE